jgi:hypothetical protein
MFENLNTHQLMQDYFGIESNFVALLVECHRRHVIPSAVLDAADFHFG